jgi:hypothetical protein
LHVLALAGEMVLTSGVAVNLKHLKLANIILPVLATYDLNYVGAP